MDDNWTAENEREWLEWLRECEEINPGSTGYTSEFD